MASNWIDNDGRLTYGKHRGELVEDVTQSDPRYLAWVLNETDICDEDAGIIRTHLGRAVHLGADDE